MLRRQFGIVKGTVRQSGDSQCTPAESDELRDRNCYRNYCNVETERPAAASCGTGRVAIEEKPV